MVSPEFSKVRPAEEKISWQGQMFQIFYTHISERINKYEPRLEMLRGRYYDFIDQTIDEVIGEIKRKDAVTTQRTRERTVPRGGIQTLEEAKATFGDWRVDLWKIHQELIKVYVEIQALDILFNQGNLSKRQYSIKVKPFLSQKASLNYDFGELLKTHFFDYYELTILEAIQKGLSMNRWDVVRLLRELNAVGFKDSVYLVPDIYLKEVQVNLRELFDTNIISLSEFMKMTYLFWTGELDSTRQSLREKINEFREEYKERLKQISQNQQLLQGYVTRLAIWDTDYPTIDELWDDLTEEEIYPLALQMNDVGDSGFVMKKVENKNRTEKTIQKVVHWWMDYNRTQVDDVVSNKLTGINALPYMEFEKAYPTMRGAFIQHVSLKTSLLLHETDETLSIQILTPSGQKTLTGFDALFDITYTIWNVSAGDPQTQNSFAAVFTNRTEEQLNKLLTEIDEKINDLEAKTDLKHWNFEATVDALEQRLEKIWSQDWASKVKNIPPESQKKIQDLYNVVEGQLKKFVEIWNRKTQGETKREYPQIELAPYEKMLGKLEGIIVLPFIKAKQSFNKILPDTPDLNEMKALKEVIAPLADLLPKEDIFDEGRKALNEVIAQIGRIRPESNPVIIYSTLYDLLIDAFSKSGFRVIYKTLKRQKPKTREVINPAGESEGSSEKVSEAEDIPVRSTSSKKRK